MPIKDKTIFGYEKDVKNKSKTLYRLLLMRLSHEYASYFPRLDYTIFLFIQKKKKRTAYYFKKLKI